MLGNNKTSFILSKDSESQNRTQYIDIIHHHILGLVEDGKLGIK